MAGLSWAEIAEHWLRAGFAAVWVVAALRRRVVVLRVRRRREAVVVVGVDAVADRFAPAFGAEGVDVFLPGRCGWLA